MCVCVWLYGCVCIHISVRVTGLKGYVACDSLDILFVLCALLISDIALTWVNICPKQ